MSYRMKITLPEAIAAQLDELAATTKEPPARVAAQMVREAIAQAAASGKVKAPVRRVSVSGVVEDDLYARAPWLEPYGGDSRWRAEMWGAIVALHGRYAKSLSWLQEGWWRDESHVEMLCALAAWRQWIDDAGRDPREELAARRPRDRLPQQGAGARTRSALRASPPRAIHSAAHRSAAGQRPGARAVRFHRDRPFRAISAHPVKNPAT